MNDFIEKIRNKIIKKFGNIGSDFLNTINITIKNYSNSQSQILASSLTYYSLLAVFPMVALMLGISKGFSLDKFLMQKFLGIIPQNEKIIITIIDVADNLLNSTKGSILTGIGIIVLLFSAIKVLMVLENTFNKIWKIKKNRSLVRRIIDYVALIFIGPIILVVVISSNTFVINKISLFLFNVDLLTIIFVKLISFLFYIMFFTLIFYIVPNTNVKVKPAVIAGIITTLLTFIIKFAFTFVQSSITNYNAIYGSLALIPIFLIWIQYLWITILIGAQITFSIQTSSEILDKNQLEIPLKIEKELMLLILILIIKKFKNIEEPYSYVDLANNLKIEPAIIKEILAKLEDFGFVNEIVSDKLDESKYQIAIDPENLTINNFIEKIENKNINEYTNIFDNLNIEDKKILEKIRENITIENNLKIKNLI